MTDAPNESTDTTTEQDPDGDPGQLNPRDERGVESEDGVAADTAAGDADPDGDPEQLNPRT
ncbi:hypothetical protein [Kineococcus rubinsiae]|uniref:hypothetical protein n=1 Tax=Kineococcus rubinsiae TaxID=2609562 RepID=UPI00142FE2DD|nr:hypothetical protein [Kineococcus rubinsiae]NIZ91063.1 hypothetical protein [Kineococcus rubinsiae]